MSGTAEQVNGNPVTRCLLDDYRGNLLSRWTLRLYVSTPGELRPSPTHAH
jgi:hypothetical protein